MKRERVVDPNNPPRTLAEQYECATVTSDLGLPRGDAAGAQGILAAAAWTEVHLGSALRRLRTQWEAEKPRNSWDKVRQYLLALPRAERRAKLKPIARHHISQYLAAFHRLRDWREAHEALAVHAAAAGIDDPVGTSDAVLRRWLEDPQQARGAPPLGSAGQQVWAYLMDCLGNANRALPQGMRGRTNNHPD